MRSLAAFLLAMSVLAIDISGNVEFHCRGNRNIVWTNVEPNRCYGTGYDNQAMEFVAIPTDWSTTTRSYKMQNCNPSSIVHQFHSNGNRNVCHGANSDYGIAFRGAGYSFNPTEKRSNVMVERADNLECIKPDLLLLNDGSTYTVVGLDNEIVQVLVCRLCFTNKYDLKTDVWTVTKPNWPRSEVASR
jgi:hypothetical protein